jgi:drug/metabolite transporter (DMT)-like permease
MPGLPNSVLGAVVALIAAFLSALGSVLQARGVLYVRDPGNRPLLVALIREPVWVGGVVIAGLSFVFHGWALAESTLAEVEPLLVLSLVFALPLGAWLCKQPVDRREWIAALAVILGLLVFLLSADPKPGGHEPSVLAWVITFGAIVGAMTLCVLAARRSAHPATRAVLLGMSAAIGLAFGAVVLKFWMRSMSSGGIATLWDWRLAFLIGGGIVVLALQQRAYRAGPFAAALSPMVGLNPILASVLGIVLFGEYIHHDLDRTVLAVGGIVIVGWGLYRLASAPAVTLDAFQAVEPVAE